jgi:HAMP domain-containing protein
MRSGGEPTSGPESCGILCAALGGCPYARAAVSQAWIGFAGGIIAAIVSVVVAIRQSRMAERLTRINHALELQRARMERDQRAEEVLKRYREPLAAAAFDLQSRLYNILQMGFLAKFGEREDAHKTTLFRLAQYFGWTEILRRDIQFLSFPEDEDTRRVAELQSAIAERFLSDAYGPALMIWKDEQRAIGERMIVEEHGSVLCMGYANFSDRCGDLFGPWLDRLRVELSDQGVDARLREVQHLLCDLVETLDAQRTRYTRDLERA